MNRHSKLGGRLARSAIAFLLLSMLTAWLPASVNPVAGVALADNSNRALIYGDSVSGSPSREEQALTALGIPYDVASYSTWSSMTQAQFAAYRVLIIGDPTCGSGGYNAQYNANTWNAAATGNVIVIGTDPVYHSFGSNTSKQYTLIKQGIQSVKRKRALATSARAP